MLMKLSLWSYQPLHACSIYCMFLSSWTQLIPRVPLFPKLFSQESFLAHLSGKSQLIELGKSDCLVRFVSFASPLVWNKAQRHHRHQPVKILSRFKVNTQLDSANTQKDTYDLPTSSLDLRCNHWILLKWMLRIGRSQRQWCMESLQFNLFSNKMLTTAWLLGQEQESNCMNIGITNTLTFLFQW